MIHCDAGPNVVRSYPVEADGAGYKAQIVNIVKATDKYQRIVQMGVQSRSAKGLADVIGWMIGIVDRQVFYINMLSGLSYVVS